MEYYIEELETGDLPTQYEVCVKIPAEQRWNLAPLGFRYEHICMCDKKDNAEMIVRDLNEREYNS